MLNVYISLAHLLCSFHLSFSAAYQLQRLSQLVEPDHVLGVRFI